MTTRKITLNDLKIGHVLTRGGIEHAVVVEVNARCGLHLTGQVAEKNYVKIYEEDSGEVFTYQPDGNSYSRAGDSNYIEEVKGVNLADAICKDLYEREYLINC